MANFINRLKPIKSKIQHDKVRQPFMSKTRLIPGQDFRVELSTWNGPLLNWTIFNPKINHNGKLHGLNLLTLPTPNLNNTGRHEFVNWSPKAISGNFENGKLSGLALIQNWMGSVVFATFEEGEMHGPCITYGVSPILEIAEVPNPFILLE